MPRYNKSLMWCSLRFLLLLSAIEGVQGFFIKHISTGSCFIPKADVVDGAPGNKWGQIYLIELRDDCLTKRAQFRFLDTGALRNDDAKGCIRGYKKSFFKYDVLYMYQHRVSNEDFVCGPKSAFIQTKEEALLYIHPEKAPRSHCAVPFTKSSSGKYSGKLLQLSLKCNKDSQQFSFGSVTCEGQRTANASCPPSQVMIIKNAFYGGSSKMNACGYNAATDSQIDATCALKNVCDGHTACDVHVNTSFFGKDPHSVSNKYLYFEYQCLNKSASGGKQPGVVCSNQLLASNGKIPDSSFTSSSNQIGHKAFEARFSSKSSWCAAGCQDRPYLQIDLGKEYVIKHVATHGDSNTESWVGLYQLNYTSDNSVWREAMSGGTKSFPGNDIRKDSGGKVAVDGDVVARVVRFIPEFYYKRLCMRVEVCGNALYPEKPTDLTIDDITARTVTISWTAPTEAGEGGLVKYIIKIWKNNIVVQNYEVEAGKTSSVAEKLIPNTRYVLSIVALNTRNSSNETRTTFQTKDAGIKGFVIKQVSSGLCFSSKSDYVDGGPSSKWGQLHLMELQNSCFIRRAQFRFLDTGALRNDEAKGCIRAYNKGKPTNEKILYLYQHRDHNKNYVCGTNSAFSQTKEGALSGDYPENNPGKYCVNKFSKSLTGKYAGKLLELSRECDEEDQQFIFGSLTCEGENTIDVGCPPSQVMIITEAYYGVSNAIDACGYQGPSNCERDVSCTLKDICDGLQSCNVFVNASLFKHDGCPQGQKKHLYFEYQCLNKSAPGKQHSDGMCRNQLSRHSEKIPDSSFTSSSSEVGHEPNKARSSSNSSWCAASCEKQPYLQIDLRKELVVKQVATLGDNDTGSWVGLYKLNYTNDYKTWVEVTAGGNKAFFGNDPRVNIGIAKTVVDDDVVARALRFIPVFYFKKACMRVEICANALYPTPPTNFKIFTKASRAVWFSWNPPAEEGDGGFTNYVIRIITNNTIVQNYTEGKEKTESNAKDLTPNTKYKVSIEAQNKHGLSDETFLYFTSEEDVPDGPPLGVKVVALNSSSLTISWSKPEENKQNGVILNYIVCVSLQSRHCIKTLVSTEEILVVTNLRPQTLYYVKVQARTKVGGGPYCNYIKQRTNIEPLLPPTNATNTTLVFTLHKPSFNLSSYIIVAIKLKEKTTSKKSTHSYTDEELKSYAESQSSTLPQPYIAAEVSVSHYRSFIFTLGAGTTKCDCTQRSGKLAYVEYYNGPLEPDQYYSVFQRFYYKGDHFSTDWSSPAKTKSTTEMSLDKPSKKDTLDGSNCENKWYINLITLFCGLIIGIGVTLIAVKVRQHRTNQGVKAKDDYAEADPQKDVNDSVYQELDLKEMKEEHDYQKLRKNTHIGKENTGVYNDDQDYETPDV